MIASIESVGISEPRTRLQTFEVLHRALAVRGPQIASKLRACGYDPERPQRDYPASVWLACLEIARAELFPELPEADGMRRLGASLEHGFRSTLLWQIHASVPYTIEALIRRMPYLLTLARPDLQAEAIYEGDHWALTVRGAGFNPHYMAGLMEAALRQRDDLVRVEVVESDARGCRIHLRLGGSR